MTLLRSFARSSTLNLFVCLLLLLVNTQGNTKTECEEMILKCKYLENKNNSRSSFSVYSYPDNAPSELLVDCEWKDDKPDCYMPPGFKLIQPVSDIVQISFPTRPISNPRCEPGESTLEIINPCQLLETVRDNQQENAQQAGKEDQRQQLFQENQHNSDLQKVKETKSSLSLIASTFGFFLVASLLVFLSIVFEVWMAGGWQKCTSDLLPKAGGTIN